MQEVYEPYLKLSAEQRKLLCFLAFLGSQRKTTAFEAYKKAERIRPIDIQSLAKKLSPFLQSSFFMQAQDMKLDICHCAPLLVYMLCENPIWLREFDKRYSSYQPPHVQRLLTNLRLCIAGKALPNHTLINSSEIAHALVPLAAQRAFLPLMQCLPPMMIPSFVADVLVFQAENDVPDPENVIGQLARLHFAFLNRAQREELHSLVALYDYYNQGRFDAEAASYDTLCSHLLAGLHALYTADYAQAFTHVSAAIRHHNNKAPTQQKGFFSMVLNNYVLLMAYHFKEADEHKKLVALLKKDYFRSSEQLRVPFMLASYLVNGQVPTKTSIRLAMGNQGSTRHPLYKYLALVASRFFGMDQALPADLPPEPRLRLLRHELSPWLSLPAEERQQLEHDFGGKPLMSRIRYKLPWELLLEELTPKEAINDDAADGKQTRVAYVVNNEYVEVREQSRLKNGTWGVGKHLSIEAFIRGADYMEDADRQVASSIRTVFSNRFDVRLLLPHFIGSDRVFTGTSAPLEPVTIDEEKPYLIIERTPTAFSVKSNLDNTHLDRSIIYRRNAANHYTVITMTELQRNYYKKLLHLGTFPLEAEEQLRQFLPRVSHVVEVHSELVDGGTTLQRLDGSPLLTIQVLPMAGSDSQFAVYCIARLIPDTRQHFQPGTGLNPCVAEANGIRYQVTRDMRGERANLELLSTFIDDNGLASTDDEPFADHTPIIVDIQGLLQLMEFAQQQTDHFFMEWPEGGQIKLKSAQTSNWNIGLKSKNGWFEVEGDVPVDEDTVLTASQLLQLVASATTKGFIRLGEGEFMAISERLRKQLARLESLATSNRGHLQISELHATLLGPALSGELDIRHDKKIEKLQQKIEKSMALKTAAPKQLKADLRDYQQDGFQWLCRMTGWGAGVCLADDMGLGKTVQTIAFLLHTQDAGPALVAAPASVVLNWRRELQRFAPSLNVIVLNTTTHRQEAISQAAAADVVLTTYGLFVTEAEHLKEKQWNTVCLDEAHVIKNRDTKTSQAVMQLKATHRIILTGTPVQNHLGELWNLFQFINPGLLGSYDQFSQKYIIPIEQQDSKERSRQLKRIVQPFILRRTKQEVIEELPEKTEVIMPVELSEDEMTVYEIIRRRAKELLELEGANSPSMNTLAEITRLRQAACSAQLAEPSSHQPSSKINTLMQLLEEIVGGGNSVLVFSQFTSFLALVRQALSAASISYAYLDGSVPMKERDQLVQDFQRGRQQVFLISLKAGGLGLNLTGANYVIHLDPWWNPAIEQQATDRAYRIGQRQNVTVYHLISQHTIEEKILRLHETKRNLADALLEGTSQSHKLTSSDLLQMLGE